MDKTQVAGGLVCCELCGKASPVGLECCLIAKNKIKQLEADKDTLVHEKAILRTRVGELEGKTCYMCNWSERDVCVERRVKLEAKIDELEEKNDNLNEIITGSAQHKVFITQIKQDAIREMWKAWMDSENHSLSSVAPFIEEYTDNLEE